MMVAIQLATVAKQALRLMGTRLISAVIIMMSMLGSMRGPTKVEVDGRFQMPTSRAAPVWISPIESTSKWKQLFYHFTVKFVDSSCI